MNTDAVFVDRSTSCFDAGDDKAPVSCNCACNQAFLERTTGFEPATLTLARRRSSKPECSRVKCARELLRRHGHELQGRVVAARRRLLGATDSGETSGVDVAWKPVDVLLQRVRDNRSWSTRTRGGPCARHRYSAPGATRSSTYPYRLNMTWPWSHRNPRASVTVAGQPDDVVGRFVDVPSFVPSFGQALGRAGTRGPCRRDDSSGHVSLVWSREL
jgi:hypothetical protein